VLLALETYRSFKMKTIRILLAVLLSIPLVSFAQEREFDETIYVLQAEFFVDPNDSPDGCAVAAQFLPTEVVEGGLYALYALSTDSESGQAQTRGERVGELGVCIGQGQDVKGLSGPQPEAPVVFRVDIDDLDYDIGGSGVLRGLAPDLPQPNMSLWGWSTTLVRTVDGLPLEVIGSMTANDSLNNSPVEGYNDNLIVTLRLYTPRDREKEAFIEAIKGAFGASP
jgi:hypothetical protein